MRSRCPTRSPAASRSRRLRRVALLAALLAATAGCARHDAPRYLRLADGFRPRAVSAPTPWLRARLPEAHLSLSPAEDGHAVWVRTELDEADWKDAGQGFLAAPRLFAGRGAPSGGEPARLVLGRREARFVALSEALHDLDGLAADSFGLAGGRVLLRADAPVDAVLEEYVELGRDRDGTWRVDLGPLHADGIPVLPGTREKLRCDLPPASTLRTTFGATRTAGPPAEVRFRVLLDGRVLDEGRLEVGPEPRTSTRTVRLPPAGRRDARLVFEVDGPPAWCVFLTPVVGPSDPPPRPAGARPDLVLFLADTFRADNLACYGGDPRLTPHLNRLANESLRFTRSWSSAAWTLPTHATLFSGLLPGQSGVRGDRDALPEAAVTVAEVLRSAGYRTVAITDAAFVSARHGLDQGFESFYEKWEDLDATLALAEAALDADDGRPLFLFLHTYRTHTPYAVSAETRARLGADLGLRGDYAQLVEELRGVPMHGSPSFTPTPAQASAISAFRGLYRGGAADLDRGFERLRASLAARGLLDHGYLLFTSDHGEAFWEHGDAGHGRRLYEEHLRVPLLIHGASLPAREVDFAVSTLDLPRTLAALAGVAPEASWGGADLLRLDRERPIAAFQCFRQPLPSAVAWIDGHHKLIARPSTVGGRDHALELAFDLALDPAEHDDLHDRAEWPTRALERLRPSLLRSLDRRLPPAAAETDLESRLQLEALGYAGDDGER